MLRNKPEVEAPPTETTARTSKARDKGFVLVSEKVTVPPEVTVSAVKSSRA
jgi:hypothetical protein